MAALPCAGQMAKVDATPARDEMEAMAGLVQHLEGCGADWSPETQGPPSFPGRRGRRIAGRRLGVASDSSSGFWAMRHLAPRKRKGGLFPASIEAGAWNSERCGRAGLHRLCRPASASGALVHRLSHRRAGDAGAGGRNGGHPD